MQNYISNLSNKTYKYPYFRSFVPKDLLTYFDGITEFRLSLNYVRKEDTKILCLNLKQITDKVFDDIRKGMKNLSLDDIKEILRIEGSPPLVHTTLNRNSL